jgi:hypothetical protein
VPPEVLKSSLNFNNNRTTYKDFFRCLAFVAFDGSFFEFLTPYTLGGHNSLNYIMFLPIFNAREVAIGRVEVFFGTPETMKPSLWIWLALSA